MDLVQPLTASQISEANATPRHSFIHFLATHKKLSLISTIALLAAVSATAIVFNNQPTGASSNGAVKGVSVEVRSNSSQAPPAQSDPADASPG